MEKSINKIIIFAKDIRNTTNIQQIPDDKPGWYRWWAKEIEIKKLLGRYFDKLFPLLKKGKGILDGYSLIYVGIAVNESIRARLHWHVNQHHKLSTVKSGFLSTFRQSVSSLITQDQSAEQATNTFIDNLLVEYCAENFAVKSPEAKQCIENIEKSEMQNNILPLNIRGNKQPDILEFKKHLRQERKKAKDAGIMNLLHKQ